MYTSHLMAVGFRTHCPKLICFCLQTFTASPGCPSPGDRGTLPLVDPPWLPRLTRAEYICKSITVYKVGIAIINHPFLMLIRPIYGDYGDGLPWLYPHYTGLLLQNLRGWMLSITHIASERALSWNSGACKRVIIWDKSLHWDTLQHLWLLSLG